MKKFCKALTLLLICVLGTGCSITGQKAETVIEDGYFFYYINEDETELVKEPYEPKEETTDAMLQELMQLLKNPDEDKSEENNEINLLPSKVKINSHTIGKGILTIDFSEEYKKMSTVREILTRAGVVKTFIQVPDIRYVQFTVSGKPLTDSKGKEIGPMNEEFFIEYSGNGDSTYQYAVLTLYFTDEDGTFLIPEKRRVYYNSNMSLEQVVLQQLIEGPRKEGNYPTLPADCDVLNTVTSDDTCYINFDYEFLEGFLPVQEDIPIYSIVNSLTDVCGTGRVQISVEGDSKAVFRETMSLNQFFMKNEELIDPQLQEQQEETEGKEEEKTSESQEKEGTEDTEKNTEETKQTKKEE